MAPKVHLSRNIILPEDIVFFNILPRLPGKSALRFKCVSKQWHSFLSTHMLQKMHLHNVIKNDHQNHHKLAVLSNKTPRVFSTIDCEAPEHGLSTSCPFPFEASLENITIITSCNGLVCVGIQKDKYGLYESEYTLLILWNHV